MDNNIDNEMEDFEEQIADNLKYNLEEEDPPRHKAFLSFKTLILGGIGVLVLIVLIALFFGGGDTLLKKDLASFKTRLALLEKRLTRFEGVELRVASLEKKAKELEQSMAEVDKSKRLVTQQHTTLIQRPDSLQKAKTLVPAKGKAPIATKKKSPSLGKKRFHEVRFGDTLYRIANKYGISVKELCRLNNIDQNKIIQPGQKLVVSSGSN
ncbi:MAG: LysM peptidoglycan-binding domain-containing protein [Deltaproteobacteria bacterium]|nr:LysM peptidoglycan-binding domain-containing protein [Deltaproteobacteria bacterium]